MALLKALHGMDPAERARMLATLPPAAVRSLQEEWAWGTHRGQDEPALPWRVWLLRSGRGFGKTRAGAEWAWARIRETPGAQVALVGATLGETERLMVNGPSGLIATARTGEAPKYLPSKRVVLFRCGGRALLYSGEQPEALRGPEHHFAWCDELAKWRRGEATWDNLMLGLRLGEAPRTLVTTTPRPVALIRRLMALEGFVQTRGSTFDNPHSSGAYKAAVKEGYAGTRLGRQELEGELIEDVEGSLWPRALIEKCRTPLPGPIGDGFWRRIVVGVDPPASAAGDACGIVVCGLGADGIVYVLADLSEAGLSPEGWARVVARAAETWGADRVIAEKNNGGDMVESVLRSVERRLPVRLVSASRGKSARAEPVAARFEAGAAKFAGAFPELEDELSGLTSGGGYSGPTRSPDRADACVWALSELLLSRQSEPRISRL
jgi:phage terminase large subunit-like protein